MYNLLRNKKYGLKAILLSLIVLVKITPLQAQEVELNLPNHDEKRYYLGIALMYNNSRFQLEQHPRFLENDSVLSINPLNTGGFGLAGIHTLRLSPRFEVRAAAFARAVRAVFPSRCRPVGVAEADRRGAASD